MKMIIRFFLIVALVIGGMILYFDQSRKFYCLSDDKCVTVWKRVGGTCYLIPQKYYGLSKPSGNYVQTVNPGNADIVWGAADSILVMGGKEMQIYSQLKNIPKIVDYNLSKEHNDSLYLSFDGRYHRYKKNVDYISINIKEGYAMSKDGKMK